MSDLDSNQSLKQMWRVWRITGIYPTKSLKWLYIVYGIIVNFIAGVLSPISCFVNIFFLANDVEAIFKTFQVSLYFFTLTAKQCMVFLQIPHLQMVKFYLDQLDQRAVSDKKEFQHLKKIVKQCRYIGLTIQMIFFLSFVPYSLSSFVKKKLFFEGWLSSDFEASYANFIPAFAIQVIPMLFQTIHNTANDAFSPISINLLNGHYRVLCMRVARIGDDTTKSLQDNYAELKACINDHRNIIRFFELIKPTISQTVLFQLLITGAVLCLTVFYYLKFNHGSVGQLVATIFDMVAILIVSFPVCYFGDSLTKETDRLTTAIYNCQWTGQTLKFQKSMLIFMQHSQRENTISAGGLFKVNLQTFIAIVRFSFSLFTMLSQMSDRIVKLEN